MSGLRHAAHGGVNAWRAHERCTRAHVGATPCGCPEHGQAQGPAPTGSPSPLPLPPLLSRGGGDVFMSRQPWSNRAYKHAPLAPAVAPATDRGRGVGVRGRRHAAHGGVNAWRAHERCTRAANAARAPPHPCPSPPAIARGRGCVFVCTLARMVGCVYARCAGAGE